MSARSRLTGIGLSLILSSCTAVAGTKMIFPIITFRQGLFSGIAISNPTGSTAAITLTAYTSDGTKLEGSGVTNDVQATIPSGGQYLALANQVFNPPSSVLQSPKSTYLWMEVTSTTDGLAGFYLEGDNSITFQYGGDLGTSGTDLYLPAVDNAGTTVTEISLVNPDTSDTGAQANITVDFLKNDGTKASDSQSLTVPKGGAIQGPLASIPGFGNAWDQVVALRIHSDRPVLCCGIVRPASGKTPIALPAEDVTAPAKVLYFPQLAQGNGWTTGLGIANLNFSAPILVDITAYDPQGNIFVDPKITNPVTRQLPPGSFLRMGFTDLFPFSDTSYKEGWIKVETDSPAINGFVEYGSGNNRAVVIAQLNSYQLSMFSHQAQADPYFTGLAVLNPGSLAANVEVFSLDNTGNTWGRTQAVLRPGQRISELLFQLVPESAGRTGGSVFVRSDRPIIATELFARNDLTALANVPPQQVTTSFNPAGPPEIAPVPPLAVVETGKDIQFTTPGLSGVQWTVDGTSGNSAEGTISDSGLYVAPAVVPVPHTLTVQASSGSSSGGASLDVVQREELIGGLTLITAVAYLDSLKRFFVAEQQSLVGAPSIFFAAAAANTNISGYSTPNGPPSFTFQIPNDTVVKMLPLTDGSNSYLILAGRDSGTIYRLDVVSSSLSTIISGLNQPTSLAFDPLTGNLLVAESGSDQITVVPRSQVLSGSAAAGTLLATTPARGTLSISAPGIQGIATDKCTGTVYATLSDGTLHEYQGTSNRVVVSGLNNPGQIVALYREGLPCDSGLSLALVESTRITLVYPKFSIPPATLIDNVQISDITFFPKDNPFTAVGEASVSAAVPSSTQGQGQVADVGVGGLYTSTPPVAPPGSLNGSGPNEDPVGDTFDDGTAAKLGYSVPDIISVTGFVQGGSSVITIKFAGPVTLGSAATIPGAPPPDGVQAFVFLHTNGTKSVTFPNGIDLGRYLPFTNLSGINLDTWIGVSLGQASFASLNQPAGVAVQVSAVGNTLTLSVPSSALELPGATAIVLVGNPAEFTDVAPNNGLLVLLPSPAQYTIATMATSGASVGFSGQTGIAADSGGNVYAPGAVPLPSGGFNSDILKVNGAGIAVVVGSTTANPPFPGCGLSAINVGLTNPGGVAVNKSGDIYVSQAGGGPTLRVSGGTVSCLLGPNGPWGVGIAADDAGNVYISRGINGNVVYEITSSGTQLTVAGTGAFGCTGGAMRDPEGLALDGLGNLYIADPGCSVVWKVTPAGSMTAAAGNGTPGFSGDGGPATSASLDQPESVAVDANGNLYIADQANDRIRRVTAGIIYTIAGNGLPGYTGDGGSAVSGQLSNPWGIAVDASGKVYFNGQGKFDAVIRQLTPIR